MALFDVSAALDTVHHQILLQRLSISFGLYGNILSWLISFLQDRSFMVAHGSTRFRWVPAIFGLLQGSVLGPLLYIIFTAILGPCLRLRLSLVNPMQTIFRLYVHCSTGQAIHVHVCAVEAISQAIETLHRLAGLDVIKPLTA